MQHDRNIPLILSHYNVLAPPVKVTFLGGAGGFSGARLWRITTGDGPFCLRQWPRTCGPDRVRFVHRVLHHVHGQGISYVPAPLPDDFAETCLVHSGTCWELAAWLPGRADFHSDPRPVRLQAAMQALAGFHLAAAEMPETAYGPSPGLKIRLDRIQRLLAGGIDRLRVHLTRAKHSSPLASSALSIVTVFSPLARRWMPSLQAAAATPLPLQPCIRDVRHDHILFSRDQVTGIVDFDALRVESVAGDVARLLGSLVGRDRRGWQEGVAHYDRTRPLADVEREAIAAFDVSGLLLSGVTWIEWLFVEGRVLDDPGRVERRVLQLAAELQQELDMDHNWGGGEKKTRG